MSSTTPAGDDGLSAEDDGPSEEEVRQYLSQMRTAPADQVLAELVQGLLNAAQVKLGRNDGRLLLDVCAAIVDTARGRASQELLGQVDQALSQLRLAQVEAEREGAAAGEDEPNDVVGDAHGGGDGASPAGGTSGAPGGAPPETSAPSKLWVPGH